MNGYLANLSDEAVWRNFYELSLEMKKFLEADDTDMFLEILRQRARFEAELKKRPDRYIRSGAGQELLQKIVAVNRALVARGEAWLNRSRRGFAVSRQYEELGFELRGRRLDGRC